MNETLLLEDMTGSGSPEWKLEEGQHPAPRWPRRSGRIYVVATDVTSASVATADAYAVVAPTATLVHSTGPLFLEHWKAEIVDDPLDDLGQLAGKPQVHDFRRKILDAVNLAPTAERYRRAIQILLQADLVKDARTVVDEALQAFPADPSLLRHKKILAPPQFTITPTSPVSERMNADREWIEQNRERYSGFWVILLSGVLVDCGPSLEEIWKRSSSKLKDQRPLVILVEGNPAHASPN